MTSRLLHLVFAAFVLVPAIAHAGGFNNPDTGPRRNGMLAVTARPDDTTAVMHNVAGLADQRGNRVLVTAMAAFLSMDIELRCDPWLMPYDNLGQCAGGRDYTAPFSPEQTYGVSPFVGGSIDLDPYVKNLVVGGAVYAPNFVGFFSNDTELSRFFGIESYFLTIMATVAAGWRPIDELAVGVGLSYMYVMFQSWRRMDFEVDEFNVKLDGREHSGMVYLGALYDPTSWLTLAAAFDTPAHLAIDGDIKIANRYDDPDDPFLTLKHRTRMLVPWKLKLGVNVHATDWLEVGADYYRWHYAPFKQQTTDLVFPTDADPFWQTALAGMNLSQPREFKDSHNACVGARVAVPGLPFPAWAMAGAQYDWSPGSQEYMTLESPYTDIYGFALGFEGQLLDELKVTVGWIHNWFVDIDVRESKTTPPTNVRAIALNNELILTVQAFF